MLNYDLIQRRGFANVTDAHGRVTGFEILVRNPNYRGLSSSLVDGVDVTIDGHVFGHELNRVVLGGREYSLAELRSSSGGRWALDEPAVVRVPLDGGLKPGIHHVAVDVRLRAPYIPIEFQPNVFHAEATRTLLGPRAHDAIKYGVSTYSYTGDMYTVMTLEDAFAEIADLGATGIEILGEGNIPGYPEPTTQWVDHWYRLLETYGLEATNYGSWIDSRMWLDRDLTVEEGADALRRDILLASRLGFTFVRPKIGVVSQDLVPHPIWEESVLRNLDLAVEKDIVICPEIHSPTPIKHPVVDEYLEFIQRTGTKNFGLLIDTGIFMTKSVFAALDGKVPESEDDIAVPLRALKVPAADLRDVMDHVVFFQAKFYEVDESLTDLHVPWDDIFDVLADVGYSGYLSSEYEGQREPYRGVEMVRRQHAMFREMEKRHF
jgi:sugar phosphate isomerase/epimerase